MRRVWIPLLLCLSWTASLSATSALTTVTGTLVGPGGSNPSGTLTLSWQRTQNDANPRQVIYPGRVTFTITNGVIPNVQLFPNSAMLPAGTCYQASWVLAGVNTTRYWTVPVSATPVDIGLVEGNIPCSNQPGPTVAPGQISSAGAQLNQVLTWNGSYWGPANGGGGGGGNPGGLNGQLQYNAAGTFGGFTLSGDCTIPTLPGIVCTKTNGVSFAPSATIDTTNAGNISSGMLPPARGGTGAGQFSQGSIPFIGASGVYQQNNAALSFDPTLFTMKVGSTGSAGAYLAIDNVAGGQQSAISLRDAGAEKFQFGKQANNSFYLFDNANSRDAFRIVSGNLLLDPIAGDTLVGGTVDGAYRLDVQSGNNTLRVFNQAGGSTLTTIQGGAAQGSSPLLQAVNNAGTVLSQIGFDGCFNELNGSAARSSILCSNLMGLSSVGVFVWRSTTSFDSGVTDTGLSRISAGLVGLGNGTQGDFSGSFKLANIILTGSGFTGGGVVSLCVDNSGNLTTSGCPGGGGGGTVTHTSGPLTAGRLVLGNGSNDITVLGSLGTSTTLYHGNAGGAGSFSAVSLTADVTGILPFANGGTGTNTNFANHFFFGNSTGGSAAPVAVQPTFADLAAGTVGAAATFPGGTLFCGGLNTQTGTSYTMNATDNCKLVTFRNASAIAVTLPQATTAGFTNGASFTVSNLGAGTVTITPTTSTINGGSTLVLTTGQGATIQSDGTNFGAFVSAAPTGSGTVTSIVFSSPLTGGTITTSGTVGCATCVTSAAALTSNQLVIGGGSQASSTLGSLGTTVTVLHGNAGGAPAFSAVILTTDVSGLLPLANGGLNASLTASNGGIFYSTASAGAVLAGTSTARQMLQSGASTTPAWSTTTWPATSTINRILYSSATSVIGEISTANGGMLNASSSGVPSMTVTPVIGVAGTSTGTLGLSGITSGVVTFQPAAAAGTWSWTVPTSGGTNLYFLQTNGSGVTSWAAAATVVGTGTLTSTAVVTGGGSQLIQTPSATTTLDTSGNFSTPGSIASGVGSGNAGVSALSQGTATSALSGEVGFMAPTSVTTPYFMKPPGAPTTGFILNTGTSDPTAWSFVPSNGSGNVLLSAGTAAIASGKTLTISNTITATATDGSTIALGGGGTVTYTVASGTSALGTSSIASGACATVVTTTATGTASTDAIVITPNASIKAVTGYIPGTSGGLSIVAYPTANAVNVDVCNWSSGSITPGSVTLNWRVVR